MSSYAWRLGIRSIRQHLRRNLAAGLVICFGYLAILMVAGYSTRVGNYFKVSTIYLQHSGHIAAFKKGGLRNRLIKPQRFSLSAAEVEQLRGYLKALPGYDFSAPYMTGVGLIGNGCKSYLFSALAYDPKMEERIQNHPQLRAVEPTSSIQQSGQALWSSPNTGQVAVGSGLARMLQTADPCPEFLSGNAVQLIGRTFDKRLSAVDAVLTNTYRTGLGLIDNQSLEMPLALLQELFATDKISYLSIFLNNPDQAEAVAETIRRDLAAQGLELDVYVWNDITFNPGYVNGMAILDFSILFVGLVVLIVVILSVINTLTIGLAESRRAIGGLRAIGYKARQVAYIFTVEAAVVSALAILIGGVIARVSVQLIAAQNIPFRIPGLPYATVFQITPSLADHLVGGFALYGLVLLVTLIKSRNYARQDILNLLDAGA